MKESIRFAAAKTKWITSLLIAILFTAPALGQTFSYFPIAGNPYENWAITTYVDLNPNTGQFAIEDYRTIGANAYTYDGHDAIDIAVSNFAAMDAGVAVRAVAAGTVELVEDGNFDRCSGIYSCADIHGNFRANKVRIHHTNAAGEPTGIATEYWHLRNGSISVAPGAQVAAGDPIGLVGSSGFSNDAHLHFSVFQNATAAAWGNGTARETFQNPGQWWPAPQVTYAADNPGVLDHGITNHQPNIFELREGPADATVYHQRAGQRVYMWANVHGIAANDRFDYYITPPGFPETRFGDWTGFSYSYGWLPTHEPFWNLPDLPPLGTWQVRLVRTRTFPNGPPVITTEFTDSFVVVPGSHTTWTGGIANWSTGSWNNGLPNAGRDAIIHRGTVQLAGAQGTAQNVLIGDGTNATDVAQLAISTVGSTPGVLNSSGGYIGLSVGSFPNNPSVSVIGAGSTWTNTGDLHVGYQNNGNIIGYLSVSGGGKVVSNRGFVGDYGFARGSVNVIGTGSKWDISTELRVGNAGIGTLSILDGGTVTNTNSYIGFHPLSDGDVTVAGGGATWNCNLLVIGRQSQGSNSLSIQSGGTVNTGRAIIGDIIGESVGSATVSGTGASWNNGNELIIGRQSAGVNTLNVQNGGQVFSGRGSIGELAGSRGFAYVNGGSWSAGTELRIGNAGLGVMSVTNGGIVSSSQGWVGYQSSLESHATVGGGGATWSNLNRITVGDAGKGKLTVSSGGNIISSDVYIGGQGTLAGDGNVYATVFNYGKVEPAPGTLDIFGTYAQLATGKLNIQIFEQDAYGKLAVTNGTMILDGQLNVSVAFTFPPYEPQIGDSFDILDWQGQQISGRFVSENLPNLLSSMKWNKDQLYQTGVIRVVAASVGLPGDFNNNGIVDGADYAVWRHNQGTSNSLPNDSGIGGIVGTAHYNLWRSNFGAMSGSGAVVGAPVVPEPSAALSLMTMGLAMLAAIRRSSKHRSVRSLWQVVRPIQEEASKKWFYLLLVTGSFLTTTNDVVAGSVDFNFESGQGYIGSATGTSLVGQDGWFTPPTPDTADYNVYTYAGNSLGVVANPFGGEQFTAGFSPGLLSPRGRRAQDFSAASTWRVTYDVLGRLNGDLPTTNFLGSFSVGESLGQRVFHALTSWDDEDTAASWSAGYTVYNAAGGIGSGELKFAGSAWQNLTPNKWYRQSVLFDFAENRIVEVTIEDLDTRAATTVQPVGWYLLGGAAPALPLPIGINLFTGGHDDNNLGNDSGNVLAFDNFNIRSIPEPVSSALFAIGCLGVLGGARFRGTRQNGCRA